MIKTNGVRIENGMEHDGDTGKPKMPLIQPPKTWKNPREHSLKTITSPWYRTLFALQNNIFHETVKYFQNLGYSFMLTPVTTDTISSPMGLGSDSLPVKANIVGDDVYLADSMQFLLEYGLRLKDNLPGTYYVSSSFRGEDPDWCHLNQFTHVECELLGGLRAAMGVAEGYVSSICTQLLLNHEADIRKCAGSIDHVLNMVKLLEKPLPSVKLEEAIQLFKELGCPESEVLEDVVEGDTESGKKLTRAGEQRLIQHYGGAVWVTHMKHLSVPFYQAYDEDKTYARNADLLFGLGEVLGLGERHVTQEQVREALDHHRTPEESYYWYSHMKKEIPLLTSGWGMGLERFLHWLLQKEDVRDFQIFPRIKGYIGGV